jgi:hypothetical protein
MKASKIGRIGYISHIGLISLIGLIVFPLAVQAQDVNAGFVSGIWYSKTPFFAGDTVRIYTALQNQSEFDISGTAEFYDADIKLGEKEFSVISGRLIEEWVDWEVTGGEHEIYVKLVNPQKNIAGEDPEPISLGFNTSAVDNRFVDTDTDGDKIGNQEDEDDDNDGLDDVQEEELGTDPLAEDTDEDGVNDAEEIKLGSNPVDKKPETKTEKTTEKAIEVARETTNKVISNLATRLAEKRDKLDQEIKEYEEKIAGATDEGEPEKDSVTGKKLLSQFYSLLIFVLGTGWLLLVVIILFIRYLWKTYEYFR